MFEDLRAAAQAAHDAQNAQLQQSQPQQPQEVEQPQEQVQEETQVQREERYQERNFKELREAKERLQRERDEAMMLVQKVMMAQQAQRQPEPAEEIDEDIAPEMIPYVKKIKQLEQDVHQYKQQSSTSIAEARLKAQYPDFDKVVSNENVEAFARQYPEMARTIDASTDLYSKAVTAYNMIKQFGVYKPNTYEADKAMAQANASKPRPTASIATQTSDTPMSRIRSFENGFSQSDKDALWAEMKASMKRI